MFESYLPKSIRISAVLWPKMVKDVVKMDKIWRNFKLNVIDSSWWLQHYEIVVKPLQLDHAMGVKAYIPIFFQFSHIFSV